MSKSRSQSKSPLADIKPKVEEDVKLETSLFPPADIKPPMPEPSPPLKREPSESVASVKPRATGPQLIGDLARAEAAALATFEEIPNNHYQYGTLGRSREEGESMTCDCQYEHGVDDPSDACGHESDCINRLTQVECLPDDCRCRIYCQNQRFQRKEYGAIEIILTEKKGFGLRAGTDLPKDSFIYEYVGDVVSHPSFMKRMRQYGEEGIKHFYFMMLQKDEYIDATKRGGIGRFANHSCNPNCYVAKWTVGSHVRMGIFANRYIRKDEELTFNYNVDRYGHEPQPCYCGEPNCVGFLGGKTQTDIAGMDDLYLDALGISDEVEMLGLKGSKKRKSKKLDEDYMPELQPLLEKDIPKLVQAIRQTQSKKVLLKLLTRIKITEDQAALRQIMRLRGFSLMHNILEDHVKDIDMMIAALEAMIHWPLIQRNKVDDSKITIPVQACLESDNETMKGLAQKLLDHWDTLEVAYRIPKRIVADGEEEQTLHQFTTTEAPEGEIRPLKKMKWEDHPIPFRLAPVGFKSKVIINHQHWTLPNPPPLTPRVSNAKEEIAAVIAAAKAAAEAEAAKVPPPSPPPDEKREKKERPPRKTQTASEKEANKEKRLLKLVGAVVVKCMSKYSKKFDHDQFKKYAKELTHIIAEKEKKSSSYKDGKLDALSDEKISKIKKFAKEYIAKVLRRLEKSKRKASSSDALAAPSLVANTYDHDHDHDEGGDVPMVMSVEQAMDLDDGSESEGDDAVGAEDAEMQDTQHSSDEVDPSPKEGVIERPPQSLTPTTPPDQTCDPRTRHPVEEPGVPSKYCWDSST